MIRTTTMSFDVKHTGDEMDRLEIMNMLGHVKRLTKDVCEIHFGSAKSDIVVVKIIEVDCP